MELEKVERWASRQHPAQPANPKNPEDYMKMLSLSKLFFTGALLCTTLVASNAQAPNARSSSISPGNSVILCMPGFVYRCNQFGCFCVKP
jgi:hypothetical protein